MGQIERVKELRNGENLGKYNCAQSLLAAYHEALGVDEETARNMGNFFGGGMMHGATCGAISATFMILGAKGIPRTVASQRLKDFREKHKDTNCVNLLTMSKEAGIDKKQHCDGLIFEAAEFLDEVLK